jgi:hypothetical protein
MLWTFFATLHFIIIYAVLVTLAIYILFFGLDIRISLFIQQISAQQVGSVHKQYKLKLLSNFHDCKLPFSVLSQL